MFKIIWFALAVAVVFAQDEPQVDPEAPVDPAPVPVPEEPPRPEEPTETESRPLVTGGHNEFTKLIKGDYEKDPLSYRVYFKNDQSYISPWHGIPLYFDEQNNIINMVVEIKRGEGLGTEINWRERMNPIMVMLNDEGKPIWEHIDYIHHYGSVPQTFNDPSVEDSLTQLKGDGHALDIVEISDNEHEIGDVVPVKILGVLGVMDGEDKIDYKIIAMDVNAQFADEIKTLADVEKMFPDLLEATRGFFRYYKYPQQLYQIALDGQFKDADTAKQIIDDRHSQWLALIKNPSPPEGLVTESRQPDAAFPANDEEWRRIAESE